MRWNLRVRIFQENGSNVLVNEEAGLFECDNRSGGHEQLWQPHEVEARRSAPLLDEKARQYAASGGILRRGSRPDRVLKREAV